MLQETAFLTCHCEECNDAAIPFLEGREIFRCARNDTLCAATVNGLNGAKTSDYGCSPQER